MTDVLYLIEPTRESIDKVLNDFKEDDDKAYDQYGAVHFAFCSPISKDLMKIIGLNKKLAERVYSVVEINCDFSIFEDNIFICSRLENK